MIVFYENINNIDFDKGWNDLMAVAFILCVIESLSFFTITFVTGKKLALLIDILIERTPNNPNHQTTKLYLSKIRKLMKNLAYTVPFITILACTSPILQFLTDYIPFSYVTASLIWMNVPFFCFTLTTYATRIDANSEKGNSKISNIVVQAKNNDQAMGSILSSNQNKIVTANSEFLSSKYDDDSVLPQSEAEI